MKPKKLLVFLIAVFAGLILPVALIRTIDFFNDKVKGVEDILRITEEPITGHIPHNVFKTTNVLLEKPDSNVAEAFRALRYRMQFLTKEKRVPAILITSSIPEDGKTFIAINLASVYSLLGKKTVLVEFDLRKPKIYLDFELDNNKGITTWLIGKNALEDIIKETYYKDLHIIPAGPIPPNPAELVSSEKTRELIILLKEMYDCVIIDSSPIGIVADALHLAGLVDTCILIVRQNRTSKTYLDHTLKELKISDIKSISLVLNDIKTDNKLYGYSTRLDY